MRAALIVAPIVVVTLLLVAPTGRGSTPALASFHEMRIYGVMGNAGGSNGEQFIELREAIGSQTQVSNAQLCFFDASGVPWARFVFPNNVSVGASNSSILVGSAAMEGDWNAATGSHLDFTFSAANTTAFDVSADVNAPIPVPAGAIVYESKTADPSCGSPEPNAIDMIAYGTGYSGAAFFGSKFNHDLSTDAGGFQLDSGPVSFPPTDNSTEYNVVTCIVARNNAGHQGTVGGGDCAPVTTPTPTTAPTATPTHTPAATATPTAAPSGHLMGDADCNGVVNTDDGIVVLEAFGGVGTIPCPERANVNCSAATDPVDTLLIVKYAAGFASASPRCTPIGQSLPG